MKTTPQLTPQVITIFVPNFKTRNIKLRQMIFTDDWVLDCQTADEKYGIWYTTIEPAQKILNLPIINIVQEV